MVNAFRCCWLILILVYCLGQVPTEHQPYISITTDHVLQNVVVIVRHGDRSQITRELGEAFHESNNLTHFWKSRLPSERTLRSLVMHQRLSRTFTLEELRKKLYAGWDFAHLPFGQLTEIGSKQLVDVGAEMRRRYFDKIIPTMLVNSSEYVHCRSTNLCRTILSARSFLTGLLFSEEHNTADSTIKDNSQRPKVILPLIYSRLKTEETMYPHADGPCWSMAQHRYALIKTLFQSPNSPYPAPVYLPVLEKKLKVALGITAKTKTKEHLNWMTWLNLMEIMICFQAHNLSLPDGITAVEVNQTIEFVSWKWGVLYKDVQLVQFAVGRFVNELMSDILAVTRGFRASQKIVGPSSDTSLESSSKIEVPTDSGRRRQRKLNSISDSIRNKDINATSFAIDVNIASSRRAIGSFLIPVPIIPIPSAGTKMLFYAGHDATLVPLMVILGIYKDRWPEYGAHLTFEFAAVQAPHTTLINFTAHHRLVHPHHTAGVHPHIAHPIVTSKLVVRVVYNNEPMAIPSCGSIWCPFPSFMDILRPYSIGLGEYKLNCHNEKIV